MKAIARMELYPGMILGEDVISQGNVLFPAGTVLTQNNIDRLKRCSVLVCTIMEDIDLASTHYEKLRCSQDFKLFEEKHGKNLIRCRHLMNDFVNEGKLIPEKLLLAIYSDMRSTYANGSVLLDYLYNLMPNEDELTINHSLNSSLLAGAFAEWMEISDLDKKNLVLAGFYYDIGKLKIPYDLLWHPGKLTEEEFETVKRHTAIGWSMINSLGLDPKIEDAVLTHHERMDGSGYPTHAKGDNIGIYARYLAIVDTYLAMASPRPHRSALTPLQIIGHFERNIAQYDAEILVPLMKRIADAQIGSSVVLNDESVWDVVLIHPDRFSRPVLKNSKDQALDLLEHPELEIVKMM